MLIVGTDGFSLNVEMLRGNIRRIKNKTVPAPVIVVMTQTHTNTHKHARAHK